MIRNQHKLSRIMPESQFFREDKRKLRLTYDGKAKGRKFTVSNTMNSLAYKPKIDGTLEEVRAFSFKEKKESLFDESKTDKLLDNFLDFKKKFTRKTNKINSVVERIEQISWFNKVDNDTLMSINDLISSIRDLHSSLLRQYISLTTFRSKGIAKDEVNKFKAAIDDLTDVAADLESRFFFLPNIADFQETTKELSLL